MLQKQVKNEYWTQYMLLKWAESDVTSRTSWQACLTSFDSGDSSVNGRQRALDEKGQQKQSTESAQHHGLRSSIPAGHVEERPYRARDEQWTDSPHTRPPDSTRMTRWAARDSWGHMRGRSICRSTAALRRRQQRPANPARCRYISNPPQSSPPRELILEHLSVTRVTL